MNDVFCVGCDVGVDIVCWIDLLIFVVWYFGFVVLFEQVCGVVLWVSVVELDVVVIEVVVFVGLVVQFVVLLLVWFMLVMLLVFVVFDDVYVGVIVLVVVECVVVQFVFDGKLVECVIDLDVLMLVWLVWMLIVYEWVVWCDECVDGYLFVKFDIWLYDLFLV